MVITAERTYEKVVLAVELAPDDYILKPFAARQGDAIAMTGCSNLAKRLSV